VTTERTRVGDADRKKLIAELDLAWQQGYLTEDMYRERAVEAGKAGTHGDIWRIKTDLPEIKLPVPAKSGFARVLSAWPCILALFLLLLVAIGPSEYFAAVHHGEGFISLADKWIETVTVLGGAIGAMIFLVGTAIQIFDPEEEQ